MKKKLLGFFILSQALALTGGFALDIAIAHAEPTSSAARADVRPTETPRTQLTQLVEQPEQADPVTEPVVAEEPAVKASEPSQPAPAAVVPAIPELVGSIGYARAGGNCVNEPGINNPGYGNPISWPTTSSEPWIGATAVFTWNHVGVVTGIWANGDIEVRHQNYWGGQSRFPRSMIRGYR